MSHHAASLQDISTPHRGEWREQALRERQIRRGNPAWGAREGTARSHSTLLICQPLTEREPAAGKCIRDKTPGTPRDVPGLHEARQVSQGLHPLQLYLLVLTARVRAATEQSHYLPYLRSGSLAKFPVTEKGETKCSLLKRRRRNLARKCW